MAAALLSESSRRTRVMHQQHDIIMKKRNLIILLSVVILALATWLVVAIRGQKNTFKQDFHIEDIASVTKIFMADKMDNHVTLTRQENDTTWLVNDMYECNQPMMDLFLETIHKMRVRQQVNKAAAPNIVKNIAAKSVKVEIYQKKYLIDWFSGKIKLFPREKHTVTYFVGHETQDMLGTFFYREGDKMPVVVYMPGFRGFIAPRFIADPTPWRSHRIVDLNVFDIERVQLEIPAMPSESFAICREGDGFYMELLEQKQRVNGFDTARVAQFLSSFTNLNFDEYAQVVPNVELDSTFSKAPRTILSITDTKGNTRVLKTYLKYVNPDDLINMPDTNMYNMFDLDRLYAVIDDADTVLIQYFVFDNILQQASFFLGDRKNGFAKQ